MVSELEYLRYGYLAGLDVFADGDGSSWLAPNDTWQPSDFDFNDELLNQGADFALMDNMVDFTEQLLNAAADSAQTGEDWDEDALIGQYPPTSSNQNAVSPSLSAKQVSYDGLDQQAKTPTNEWRNSGRHFSGDSYHSQISAQQSPLSEIPGSQSMGVHTTGPRDSQQQQQMQYAATHQYVMRSNSVPANRADQMSPGHAPQPFSGMRQNRSSSYREHDMLPPSGEPGRQGHNNMNRISPHTSIGVQQFGAQVQTPSDEAFTTLLNTSTAELLFSQPSPQQYDQYPATSQRSPYQQQGDVFTTSSAQDSPYRHSDPYTSSSHITSFSKRSGVSGWGQPVSSPGSFQQQSGSQYASHQSGFPNNNVPSSSANDPLISMSRPQFHTHSAHSMSPSPTHPAAPPPRNVGIRGYRSYSNSAASPGGAIQAQSRIMSPNSEVVPTWQRQNPQLISLMQQEIEQPNQQAGASPRWAVSSMSPQLNEEQSPLYTQSPAPSTPTSVMDTNSTDRPFSRRQNTEQTLKECGLYDATIATGKLVTRSKQIDTDISDFKMQMEELMKTFQNSI